MSTEQNEAPSSEMSQMNLENGIPPGDTNTTSPTPAAVPSPVPEAPTPTPAVANPPPATAPPPPPTADSPAPAAASPSPASPSPGAFKEVFKLFSKFGEPKSDGKLITLSQSDKWMKQAKVIDGKKITTTDTGIYFKKLKQMKLKCEDYQKFLEDLAKNKKVEVAEIKNKMANCGQPGHTGIATGKSAATVDRLTDVSKYTGSHKQRFDETGKGKGIAGRKDLPDQSGYVSGYQHKDTFVLK